MIISVIITNYNKARFIRENLNSLLNQKNKNFEVIFFDDNSSDGSIKIVQDYKKKFKKIKIIRNFKKKNLNGNFNQINAIEVALNHTSGKFITLLDSDDFFSKTKIEQLIKITKIGQYKLILNSYYNILRKKKIINSRHFRNRKYIYPVFPPTSCITVEKNFLKKNLKKIKTKNFSTCWFDFRFISYATKYHENKIIYLNQELSNYRITESGADQQYTKIYNYNFWRRKIEALLFYFFI